MKTSILLITLIIAFSSQAFAQGDLHVKGKIRSDSLANPNYLLIYADSTGTLDTLAAGLPGQVLISNGLGGKPYWGNASGAASDSVLFSQFTAVGTDVNTLEKVLASYVLPGNTLDANNIGLEITIFGRFAANNNTKTIRFKFNGNNIYNTDGNNDMNFLLKVNIYRENNTTSKAIGFIHVGNTIIMSLGTPVMLVVNTVDFSNNIPIEFTGQNAVASPNDIILEGIVIKLIR